MARQRFIWPSIWTDPTLGRLKPIELLLYIGCFSNADDDGRLLGDAAYLRSRIFPYQDLTLRRVKSIRDSVCDVSGSLHLYEVGGVEYLYLSNWSEYQKPKYPTASKLPPPPPDGLPQDSGNGSGKPSPSLPPRVGLGWEGSKKSVVDLGDEEQRPDFNIPHLRPAVGET